MRTRESIVTVLTAAVIAATGCAGDEMIGDEDEESAEPTGDPPAEAPPGPDVELMVQEGLVDEAFVGEEGPALDELAYTAAQLEGENMMDRRGWSGVYYSPNAPYGNWHQRTMFANGEIGNWVWVPTSGHTQVTVAARGSWCTHGWPVMTTYAYDQSRGWHYGTGSYGIDSKWAYDSARYFPYHVGGTWMNAGWNWISVVMSNDSYVAGYCDANLTVDYVNLWRW